MFSEIIKIFFLGRVMTEVASESLRNSLHVNVVSPGFMGFSSPASLSNVGPAIDTGIRQIQKMEKEIKWTSTFLYDPSISDCTGLLENIQNLLSRWYYKERDPTTAFVILTSGCLEGLYLNQFAASWDVLLITSSLGDDTIPDRNRSPSWLTTTPFPPPHKVFCSLLPIFNWTKVYVTLDRNDPSRYYEFANKRVVAKLQSCGVQFTQQTFSSDDTNFSPLTILREFHSKSRVLLYFGQPFGLRKLLVEADRLNMTAGQHVLVAVVPWFSKAFGNFTWQNFDKNDEVVRTAYKSVILLNLIDDSQNESPAMKKLTSEWAQLSVQKYNNTDLQSELFVPGLTSMHATIELAGIVISKAISQFGRDKMPSGRILSNMLMNRTFDLEVGPTKMTSYGHSSFRVRVSYFHEEQGSFKAFLYSEMTNDDQFKWITIADTRWFGGNTFPPDEPRCGFDGLRDICQSPTSMNSLRWTIAGSLLTIFFGIGATFAILRAVHRDEKTWWTLNPTHVLFTETTR